MRELFIALYDHYLGCLMQERFLLNQETIDEEGCGSLIAALEFGTY